MVIGLIVFFKPHLPNNAIYCRDKRRFSLSLDHYPNVSIEVYVCYGIVNFFVIQAFLTLSHSWYLRCSLLTTFRMSHQQSHNRPHATIILHSRPSLSQRGMKGSSSTIDQLIPGLTKHC